MANNEEELKLVVSVEGIQQASAQIKDLQNSVAGIGGGSGMERLQRQGEDLRKIFGSLISSFEKGDIEKGYKQIEGLAKRVGELFGTFEKGGEAGLSMARGLGAFGISVGGATTAIGAATFAMEKWADSQTKFATASQATGLDAATLRNTADAWAKYGLSLDDVTTSVSDAETAMKDLGLANSQIRRSFEQHAGTNVPFWENLFNKEQMNIAKGDVASFYRDMKKGMEDFAAMRRAAGDSEATITKEVQQATALAGMPELAKIVGRDAEINKSTPAQAAQMAAVLAAAQGINGEFARIETAAGNIGNKIALWFAPLETGILKRLADFLEAVGSSEQTDQSHRFRPPAAAPPPQGGTGRFAPKPLPGWLSGMSPSEHPNAAAPTPGPARNRFAVQHFSGDEAAGAAAAGDIGNQFSHTDWDKFNREARRSSNVIDMRGQSFGGGDALAAHGVGDTQDELKELNGNLRELNNNLEGIIGFGSGKAGGGAQGFFSGGAGGSGGLPGGAGTRGGDGTRGDGTQPTTPTDGGLSVPGSPAAAPETVAAAMKGTGAGGAFTTSDIASAVNGGGAGAAYGPQDRGNMRVPASIRYNNPGAQWPSAESRRFGQTDAGVIGGGNKIAGFPTPVHGLASNMALLQDKYVGMTVGAAIKKWSGGGRGAVPGFDPNQIITPEMARDPNFLHPFFTQMAEAEAGRKGTISPAQIDQAIEMNKAGSAAAYEQAHPEFVQQNRGRAGAGRAGADTVNRPMTAADAAAATAGAPAGAGSGVSADQSGRPYHQEGKVTLGGQTFDWASGGAKRGSIPYGNFPINIGDQGPIGQRIGAVATVGGRGGEIPDPKFPGQPREGIEIHPGSSNDLDRLYTEGCFGVPPAEWPAFKAALLKEAQGGPLELSIGRNGRAAIMTQKEFAAQGAAQKAAKAIVKPPAAPATAGAPSINLRRPHTAAAGPDEPSISLHRPSAEERYVRERAERLGQDSALGRSLDGGGGGSMTAHGHVTLNVNVPQGTQVGHNMGGLFKNVTINRNTSMARANNGPSTPHPESTG